MALVTIASFASAPEAHLLRLRLQQEGIAAYVVDEFTISAMPFYSQAFSGVKVQVLANQAEEAQAILDGLG